jgi:hypothetical protein
MKRTLKIKILFTLIFLSNYFFILHAEDINAVNYFNDSGNEQYFEENKGQIYNQIDNTPNTQVTFMLNRPGMKVFLMNNGISTQFEKTHYPKGYIEKVRNKFKDEDEIIELEELQKQICHETWRVDMELIGANLHATIVKEGKSIDYVNYYNRDVLFIHHYEKITYKEIYPGIDWVIYTYEGGVKYDFIVHPGANPNQIRWRYSAHEKIILDKEGNLQITTSMGDFSEQAPVSYQEGKKINTKYQIKDGIISFHLQDYSSNEKLIIDPFVRLWGTYFGGFGAGPEFAHDVIADNLGNVFIVGQTESSSSIALAGHQINFGGSSDAFLAKFSSDGTLIWSTYYGGGSNDLGYGVAIDGNANVFLGGMTRSTTGISSFGFQNTYAGNANNTGVGDAFLVKFNSLGVRQWGTYYGGSNGDAGSDVATDNSGNVYLAGWTSSTNGIASNGHQNTFGGGNTNDAFLVKFNTNGVRQWGTYYGGPIATFTGTGNDVASNISIDNNGFIYLAGKTSSSSGISFNGHQNTYTGGSSFNAFLVKFNTNGVRQWGTYYGGTQDGYVACDNVGNVYLTGSTNSTNGISYNGFQNSLVGGPDGYAVKFNNSGVRQWATYLGGSGAEVIGKPIVDLNGNLVICGRTESLSSFSYLGYQNTYGGGTTDAFCMVISELCELVSSSYYGGSDEDWGIACAIDQSNNVYLCGGTLSVDNISESGHQLNLSGGWDAFLVKFGVCTPSASAITQVACQSFTINGQTYNQSGTYIQNLTSSGGCDSTLTINLTIQAPNSSQETHVACNSYTWPANGLTYSNSGTYTTTLINALGCDSIVTLNLTVNASSGTQQVITACDGYTWPINGLTYTNSGTYTTTLINALGCDSIVTLNLTVNASSGTQQVITACDSYTWPTTGLTYTNSGTYATTLINALGCDSVVTLDLIIQTVDVTISYTSPTITANSVSASYQWLDCNANFSMINGANSQVFTATAEGNYAVEVSQNGCVDTSECQIVMLDLGISDELNDFNIKISPNPTNENCIIMLSEKYKYIGLRLISLSGQKIWDQLRYDSDIFEIEIPEPKGVYFLEIEAAKNKHVLKIIKQ